jgi:hypothetical protein
MVRTMSSRASLGANGLALLSVVAGLCLVASGAEAAEPDKGQRPSVVITTSDPVQDELGEVRVQVTGGRIATLQLKLDGWFAGEPLSIEGGMAIGHVSWPLPGPHRLVARVTLRGGRVVTGRATVTVAPLVRDRFQLVYLYPAGTDPVAGRVEGIREQAGVVDAWFAGQLGGLSPRFATDAAGAYSVVTVQSALDATAMAAESDIAGTLVTSWRADGTIPSGAVPVVYIEGRQSFMSFSACGWSSGGRYGYVTIPMANCDIYPVPGTGFPYGGSYLLAHEMTHALGAVSTGAPHADGSGHVSDDPRDLLFNGSGGRDWSNLTLDPGHDDYYGTGRTDLANIEDSPLLEGR